MKSLFKYISSIFFTICLVLFFIVLMLFARELKDVPDITQANLQDPLSSEIYDKNLNLIATVGAEKREYVSINDIPKNITDAVLTTEDSRFQSHIGIDPIRLIKAVLVNIRSNSAQQGASTITQQVVKNSLLTSDKSLQRKIQEAYLSLKLENRYSKDDILEMYMNKIYYSDGQYGVKTAAKYFYNKELDQLTLSQIALLTGMPQQPNLYNPYDYPEQAKERRNTVLYALLNNDKITEAEYNNAINTPIMDGIVKKTKEERANQHTYNPKFAAYIDQITKELKENQNFENIKDPLSMGLKIYTNLNPELQIYVQDMLDNQSSPMKPHASQAAISVLDTKTGLIEAIGGGKNYKAGGYNVTSTTQRLPAYDPEYNWNYEIGAKLAFLNGTLQTEMSLFYIDWKHQQVTTTVPGVGNIINNAGHSNSKGFELSATYRPITSLELQANYGYTYAQFLYYKKSATVDFTGNMLPMVPKQTMSFVANYTLSNVAGLDKLMFNAALTGTGKIYWTEDNKLKQPFYALLNLKIAATKGRFTWEVWTKNTTNTHYMSYAFVSSAAFAQQGKPFMIGTSLVFKLNP